MYVLRAPRRGPFMLTPQPLPQLIASLQASSAACNAWALNFTALGAAMLLTSAACQALDWHRERVFKARRDKALALRHS